jgi:asparagine synthase (glutamine-hydrolysing)
MNFSVPMEMWLAGPMRAVAADLLLNDAAVARGYCDPDALRRMLTGRSRAVSARGIWGLMALELWHRAIEGSLDSLRPSKALQVQSSGG